MKAERITEYADLVAFVTHYQHKGTPTNCYVLPEAFQDMVAKGNIEVLCGHSNACLLWNKDICKRLYYFLNDLEEVLEVADDKPLVLEILYRDVAHRPEDIVRYWFGRGFRENLVREMYSMPMKDFQPLQSNPDIRVRGAQSLEDVQFACDLFHAAFDPYSGDFLDMTAMEKIWTEDGLLIAEKAGRMVGALHRYTVGKCAWIGHVAVSPQNQGAGVGGMLVNAFAQINRDDSNRLSLWVQQQNVAAVSMYRKVGFKYAGKSTLSMIKIHE